MDWWADIVLPPGYHIEYDADLLLLRRPDGGLAAAFSVAGADPPEVAVEAWEDAAQQRGPRAAPAQARERSLRL